MKIIDGEVKVFRKAEYEEFMSVCNIRLTNNMPCRNCKYYSDCDAIHDWILRNLVPVNE